VGRSDGALEGVVLEAIDGASEREGTREGGPLGRLDGASQGDSEYDGETTGATVPKARSVVGSKVAGLVSSFLVGFNVMSGGQ
jgi:hypothetical protein